MVAATENTGHPYPEAEAMKPSRREFLGSAHWLWPEGGAAYGTEQCFRREFREGRSAVPALQVSAIGVGGYHLGSAKDQSEAQQIVDLALDAGINFFDNAWEYHEDVSEEWLGNALKGKRDRRGPDDQGLHAWPRKEHRHADAGGIAQAVANRSHRYLADP